MFHVKWFFFKRGMTRTQVVGLGNGVYVWTEPANVLSKESRTADNGWFFILVGWAEATSPSQ
jgi:hypothetical protein